VLPVLALLLVSVTAATAEEQGETPPLVDTIPITPGSKAYPQELAARGVQGKVTLRAILSAEGKFSEAMIEESSRSEELDAAALDLVPRLKYTSKSEKQKPVPPGPVRVAIEFVKDGLETLRTKTCADFNLDAAYFKEKFPERPLTDMTVMKLMTGILTFTVKREQQLTVFKNIKPIKEQVIEQCAQSPDKKFLELALTTATDWKAGK